MQRLMNRQQGSKGSKGVALTMTVKLRFICNKAMWGIISSIGGLYLNYWLWLMLILFTIYVLDVDLILIACMLDIDIVFDLYLLGISMLNYCVSDLMMLFHAHLNVCWCILNHWWLYDHETCVMYPRWSEGTFLNTK